MFNFNCIFILNSGRIVGSAATTPVVIPMWITGFNRLMPEGRPFPYKYLPRTGQHLSVTFGAPISERLLKEKIVSGFVGVSSEEEIHRRIGITNLIHDAVESLGRSASGNSLGYHPKK